MLIHFLIKINNSVNILIETCIARSPFHMRHGGETQRRMTPAESDAGYKARGAAKVIRYNPRWDRDVREQNRGKAGRPFKYSDAVMAFISVWKATVNGSYRDCWGRPWASHGDSRAPTMPPYGEGWAAWCPRSNTSPNSLSRRT